MLNSAHSMHGNSTVITVQYLEPSPQWLVLCFILFLSYRTMGDLNALITEGEVLKVVHSRSGCGILLAQVVRQQAEEGQQLYPMYPWCRLGFSVCKSILAFVGWTFLLHHVYARVWAPWIVILRHQVEGEVEVLEILSVVCVVWQNCFMNFNAVKPEWPQPHLLQFKEVLYIDR